MGGRELDDLLDEGLLLIYWGIVGVVRDSRVLDRCGCEWWLG